MKPVKTPLFTVTTSLVLSAVIGIGLLIAGFIYGAVWLYQRGTTAAEVIATQAEQAVPQVKERVREKANRAQELATDGTAQMRTVADQLSDQAAARWTDLFGHAPLSVSPIPAQSVPGDDPPGWPAIAGLVRTSYALKDDHVAIEYRGRIETATTLTAISAALREAGYQERVLRADARGAELRYDGPRQLALDVRNRGDAIVVRVHKSVPAPNEQAAPP